LSALKASEHQDVWRVLLCPDWHDHLCRRLLVTLRKEHRNRVYTKLYWTLKQQPATGMKPTIAFKLTFKSQKSNYCTNIFGPPPKVFA